MRCLALLVLLAGPVLGQPIAPEQARRAPAGTRAVLAVAGVAGGLGAATLAYHIVEGDGSGEVVAGSVAFAYLLGTVLAESQLGRALNVTAPAEVVVREAIIGTAAGLGAGIVVGLGTAVAWYALAERQGDVDLGGIAAGLGVGIATAAVVPAVYLAHQFRVAPAALAAPTGDRAVGLGLQIGL